MLRLKWGLKFLFHDTAGVHETDDKIEYLGIEKAKQTAYAETIKQIVSAISPDLIAALTTKANANLLETATKNMSAYAIANGESVADTVNRLMRGTSLEGIIESATK